MRPPLCAVIAAFAFCIAGGVSAPADAASFDCAKAKAPDEIAVCADVRLSEMDTEMGALWFSYEQFPFLMGMNSDRMGDAQDFLQTRAACSMDTDCLQAAYRARITALKADITSAMKTYCTQQ